MIIVRGDRGRTRTWGGGRLGAYIDNYNLITLWVPLIYNILFAILYLSAGEEQAVSRLVASSILLAATRVSHRGRARGRPGREMPSHASRCGARWSTGNYESMVKGHFEKHVLCLDSRALLLHTLALLFWGLNLKTTVTPPSQALAAGAALGRALSLRGTGELAERVAIIIIMTI